MKPIVQAQSDTEFCEGESVVLQVTNAQPNTTYTWSNGQSGLQNTVSTTQSVYVIATNQTGCSQNSDPIDVKVNPIQKPEIAASGITEFCDGGSVTLTVTNAAGADQIRWSNGEIGNSITVTASGNYYATLYSGNCQRNSEEIAVNVIPNVLPVIQAQGPTDICEGQTLILQIANPQANVNYVWSNGEVGRQIEVSRSGSYFVTSENNNNCSRTSEVVQVNVLPISKPTISISNDSTFCEGDSIILTINESAESYRWSSGQRTKSITVKSGGVYRAFISNGQCERDSDPITIRVNPNPKPSISYINLTACEGDSVRLSAPNAESYLWSNGATTKDIYVKVRGKYSVSTSNSFGCSNTSDSVEVRILPNAMPTITSSNGSNICEGESTTLTSTEGEFYLWSTGETTRSIEVTRGGDYWVSVTNSNSCSRTSRDYQVVLRQPLALNPIPNQQICVNGDKLNLDEINTNNLGGRYEGEGVTNNIFDPNQVGDGIYQVNYIFNTEFGCQSSTNFQIEVARLDSLSPGDDLEVCINSGDILLQVQGLPVGVQIQGEGVTGNLFKPDQAGVGIHEITFTYTNRFGCVSTAKRIITVLPLPSAPQVTGNMMVCNQSAITLVARSTILDNSPITYNWYREDEQQPFETGSQIRYVVTKNENIYVSAVSGSSCPSERTQVQIQSYTPEIRLTASSTTISQGSSVQFTLQDLPGSAPSVRWEYDFGDGFTSQERNPLHYYNKPGVYSVVAKAYSQQGCVAEIVETDFIVVSENPIVVTPPTTGTEPIEDETPHYTTRIYPNPIRSGQQATLRAYNENANNSTAVLQVYSISGTPIFQQYVDLAPGENEVSIDNLDKLVANTYYLFVITFDGGRSETIKILAL